MIRLLVLTELLTNGGTAKHVAELLPALRDAGIYPVVWSRGKQGHYAQKLRESGIRVEVVPRLMQTLLSAPLAKNFDLIHSYLYGPHVADAVVSRLKRIPYVKSTRNTGHWRTDRLSVRSRIFIRKFFVSRHVVNSNEVKSYLICEEGIPAHKISVIQNGILDQHAAPPHVSRNDFGLNDDHFVMLSVAWMKQRKNIDFLIRAMVPILKNCSNAKLLLLGDGPLENEYRKLASDLDVESNCVFLGCRIDGHALMRISDVLVSASTQEGLSNATIEAQMMGLPAVVCVEAGGNAEIVKHGQTGYLYPAGHVDDYVSSVMALREPARQLEMAVRAREHYLEHFTLERQVGAYLSLYHSILQNV